jgi:hypothetical protein
MRVMMAVVNTRLERSIAAVVVMAAEATVRKRFYFVERRPAVFMGGSFCAWGKYVANVGQKQKGPPHYASFGQLRG